MASHDVVTTLAGRSDRKLSRRRMSMFSAVAVLLATVLVFLVAYPIGRMLVSELLHGWHINTAAFGRVLNSREFRSSLTDTIILIAVPAPLALIIGGTFAWLSERTDAKLGRLSTALPLVPLVLPPIAFSIGWIFLLQKSAGLINIVIRSLLNHVGIHLLFGPFDIFTWYGMIFLYTIYFVPFAYMFIAAALRNLDPALEEAARVAGASPLRTLIRVSLPAVRPAILASSLLMLVLGLAQFSFGRTIGTAARIEPLSVYLVRLFQSYPPQWDTASAVGVLMLLGVSAAWILHERVMRRQEYSTVTGRARADVVLRLGKLRWVARAAMLAYLAAASVLPFLALLLVALQPYWTPQLNPSKFTLENFRTFLIHDGYARHALFDSLGLGIAGATIAILASAILVTFTAARSQRTGRVVGGVMRTPAAFSHIVLAVAFLIAFAGTPTHWAGTLQILLLAYVVINMPQAWATSQAAIQEVNRDLVDAALLSGSSLGRVFRRIVLPLTAPGLLAGWAILLVLIVGDLTASAILAGTNNPVIGFVILDVYDNGTFSEIAALGTTISVITGAIVLVVFALGRLPSRAAGSA
jgi:iron(III) transport system permease protein